MKSTRDEFSDLIAIYLPIGIAVAAIIFALILFALVRYRRGAGRPVSRRSERTALELTYAAGLALVVAFLLTMTFRTEANVDEVVDDPDQVIEVTAFQWGWRWTYPDANVSVIGNDNNPPVFAVPVDSTIRFELTSRDVIHSFWIPEQRFKRDAFPKRTTEFDLRFDEEGMNGGVCAEFCGLRHAKMLFNVLVLPEDEYLAWLDDRRAEAGDATGSPVEPPAGSEVTPG